MKNKYKLNKNKVYVIIVQIIIASLTVGYCISNISTLYGKNEKQVRIIQIGLELITLLPPGKEIAERV